MDPELELIPPASWPERAVITGAEAVWDYYRQFDELVEGEQPYEVTELIGAGDRVLFCQESTKHAHGSGADLAFKLWGVVRYERGRARSVRWFTDRDAAAEAAGLGGKARG